MKVAPEHIDDKVLKYMNKPDKSTLMRFKKDFDDLNKKSGKKQFLTYYLIAAHPGSELRDMENLKDFANSELQLNPEQVQVFIPTPSTYSALMYYTEIDPWTREPVFVEKDPMRKQKQKDVVTEKVRYKKSVKRESYIKQKEKFNYRAYKELHSFRKDY
jgi:radical SAM superfamily enzyme YgiQ (UPF0313 family)